MIRYSYYTAFTEQQKKRDNKRYTTADLNKDGALSSDELVSMFHPEESAHMSPVIVEVRLIYSFCLLFLFAYFFLKFVALWTDRHQSRDKTQASRCVPLNIL